MNLFEPQHKPLTLRPYQQNAVDAVYRHLRQRDDNPCAVLPTGCHAAGHPILMHDGSVKRVEDVIVGDMVMGPDSQPRRVLQLCRGNDELYRITPLRGEPFIVNGDHILSLVCTNEGKGNLPCQRQGGEIENVSVREYLQRPKWWRHLRKLRRVSVDFNTRSCLPIPPYILGLLLGDGYLEAHSTSLTTADETIARAWTTYAQSVGCEVTPDDHGGRCPTYHLVRSEGRYNVVTESLAALGLAGTYSATKFLPPAYLTASRHERLALLAGLIDSDGAANKSGIDYITQSHELSADIVFLARSLGFWAKVTEKYSTCQTGAGGWFYRISIWGDFSPVPIRLPRRIPTERRMEKSPLRTGFTIEAVGQGPFYGFTLDGDHLYVDGLFMVHHNSGKTPVMATICRDAVQQWNGRVLILAHVKELLEQATDKLHAMAPDLWNRIGVYSAGLKSRDTDHAIIVAGIQSVYRRAAELDRFDLILIDEAHMLPPDGEGMYRTFLEEARVVNPHVRLVGLTATPYRMSTGLICGPENLLNHVCYEVGVRELIVQGYLCPLKTKAGKRKVDTSNLHIRGGEFVSGEVEALMDDESLVRSACREILEQTADRHSVLIFAASVKHALHVQQILTEFGQSCGFVSGETLPFERTEFLTKFKEGKLKYLVNVNVLTTGFDAPNIDCVTLLRPTNSPGLYYQMVGRGFRLDPSKENCLVLDFGGNILRHGPVDALEIAEKTPGAGQAPAKECPQCQAVIHAAYSICPECGYEFPQPQRNQHEQEATTAGILTGEITNTEHHVSEVYYSVHVKRDASEDHPRTMRVDYTVGFNDTRSEWVCFEHTGYARRKAEAWWRLRSDLPVPATAQEAVEMVQAGALAQTLSITVRTIAGEKYQRIVNCELGERPLVSDNRDEVDVAVTPDGSADDAGLPIPEDDIPF